MIVHHPRLSAGLLTLCAALTVGGGALLASPATAAAPAPAVQVGLFGSGDPTYDGVFRQSLSLLAYVAAGQTPPADAVTWLLGQQCADGGFQSFREDTAVACLPSDGTTFSGPDSNSTAMAAAALQTIGRTSAAGAARSWLDASQSATDGGFPYYLGADSDANSTAIALIASTNAGLDAAQVAKGGHKAVDFLAGLQVGCAGAAAGEDGAFAYQDYGTGLLASDLATVQTTFALTGLRLPFVASAVSTTLPRASCPTAASTPSTPGAAEQGAGYIARLLDTYGGAVPTYDFNSGRVTGSVDAGSTAWAVLSLAAVGVGKTQLDTALGILAARTATSTAAGARVSTAAAARDDPGLLALTALGTYAAGGSSSTVTALVTRIGATARVAVTPTATPTATPTPSTSPSASATPAPTASTTPVASPTPTPVPSTTSGDSSDVAPTLSDTGSSTLALVLGAVGLLLVLIGAGAVVLSRRGDPSA